jgi:uncharacterized protein YehS (DUF1456 family)
VKTNDCLRRIRYILDLGDSEVVELFVQADYKVSRAQVIDWLRKDDDPDFKECSDVMLATFLNGLINHRRGRKDGAQPVPENTMNNNIVFRKLKIAFNLQAQDILSLLQLAEFDISKHELSAFFRRPDHKHYRECKDQILRNFLLGLQIKHRGAAVKQREEGGL